MDNVEPRGFEPRELERRVFLKAAGIGLLAFTVGGAEVMMTPGQARAQGVPYRTLNAQEAETIDALGEAFMPGARKAGISHYIDHQVSVPYVEALLEARTVNIKPPFVNYYRAVIAAVDKAATSRHGKPFAAITPAEQAALINLMRQNKIEDWQAPPAAPQVYFVLRSDAVDVVCGTMEGYEALGVPYQAHIVPENKW